MRLTIHRLLTGCLTASLLPWSNPSVAEPLRPQGAWVVDFDDTQCTALRKFGSAKDPIDLMIRPAFNGQSFEFFLGSKGGGDSAARTRQGTIDLGAGEMRRWFVSARPNRSSLRVIRVRLPDREVRAGRATGKLRVNVGPENYELETGSLAEVLKTLDTCVADLRAFWNAGVVHETSPVQPKGDLRSVFKAEDYPSEAVADGVEGSVQYTLLIDEKGSVVGCDPIMTSGAPLLELMGCQVIVARAKFTPGKDSAGRPVRQTVTTPPIRWALE